MYYLRLPRDIADYHIILMDATVATGAAAMMAIRILLDHDVPEENIMLLSLLMAQSGNANASVKTFRFRKAREFFRVDYYFFLQVSTRLHTLSPRSNWLLRPWIQKSMTKSM